MVPRTIFCSAVFQKYPLGLFADSGLARKCSENGSSTIWVCSPALGGPGRGGARPPSCVQAAAAWGAGPPGCWGRRGRPGLLRPCASRARARAGPRPELGPGPSRARAQPGPNPSRPGPKPRPGPSRAQARAGPWARRHGVKLTRLRRNGSIVERISANCLTSCLMLRASMPIRATRYIFRTLLRIHKDNFCLEGVSMHNHLRERHVCAYNTAGVFR